MECRKGEKMVNVHVCIQFSSRPDAFHLVLFNDIPVEMLRLEYIPFHIQVTEQGNDVAGPDIRSGHYVRGEVGPLEDDGVGAGHKGAYVPQHCMEIDRDEKTTHLLNNPVEIQ